MADARTFFDLYAAGLVRAGDVNDFVERWHATAGAVVPLPAYLGLTDDEYGRWLADARCLPVILAARRKSRTDWDAFDRIMTRAGGAPPRAGDEWPGPVK